MKNKKGFTLIELLVVIAIIGLLSTLAVVSLNGARSKARDARRTSDLKAMQSALELYIGDNENAPTLPGSWTALGTALASYLPAGAPTDPGSNEYVYCVDSTSGSDTYLIGGVLETTDAVAGDLDGAVTTYAVNECWKYTC